MNKKEIVLSLLDGDIETPYIPAGFFIHFDSDHHHGEAAVNKHLEYFKFTGMDFVKIQYETRFPSQSDILKPTDWHRMPCFGADFYQDQVDIAKGLVEAVGSEALVIMTLYSPFMLAGQAAGKNTIFQHLKDDPESTKKGLEIITESLLIFVSACVAAGIDGFYHSTQGGEIHRFGGSDIFVRYIKPFDLMVMREIENNCQFNILHICDYEGAYADLSPFLEYPGHIVNTNLNLEQKTYSPKDLSSMFGRPFMGGVDRHGIITDGKPDEIREAVNKICAVAPEKFFLGADCTLPADVSWENIKIAIETAHSFQAQ
jgi:uroporphyrinogen decarboxylase